RTSGWTRSRALPVPGTSLAPAGSLGCAPSADQTSRYARLAVVLKSASFSSADARPARRLNAFQSAAYPMPIFSTGKLLSNMQRVGPTRSMQNSMYAELGMEHPCVERQAERRQASQPGAEIGLLHEMRAIGDSAVADHLARVPGRGVPHAAEPPTTGANQGLEHGRDSIAQGEIGESD